MLKMVVTDLDGTLLNDDRKVSKRDFETLVFLKEKEVILVVATGRSLYSVNQVLDSDFPIDYLIFSNGAGILDFKTGELLFESHLNENEIKNTVDLLVQNNVDFSIQLEIPNNHKFVYYKANNFNSDFENRCKIYGKFCSRLELSNLPKKATQLIGIINQGYNTFEKLKNSINGLKVIRTTSPLDNKTIWIEIFKENVSKSIGIEFLRKMLNVEKDSILTIGNDYNDLDMLNYTKNSFVVSSARERLKEEFNTTVASNNESAFSEAVFKLL